MTTKTLTPKECVEAERLALELYLKLFNGQLIYARPESTLRTRIKR